MGFKKSYAIAAFLAVTTTSGYGAYKWHAYSKSQDERYSAASAEVQAKLTKYETLPSIERLREVPVLLDDYTAHWGAKNRDELQELSNKIKAALANYCTDPKCEALVAKQAEYEKVTLALKNLKAPLEAEGVRYKSFVCTKIFDQQGESYFMECTDPSVMKRVVLEVSERTAKGFQQRAHPGLNVSVKDGGIQEVTMKDGAIEYAQVYKVVSIDWDAVENCESALRKLEQEIALLKYEVGDQVLEQNFKRVSKTVDSDLKRVAEKFQAKYWGLKPSNAEADKGESQKRRVEEQYVSGVTFIYDIQDVADLDGTFQSMIHVGNKDIVVYKGRISHGEAITTSYAGILVYKEISGGEDCDASVYKGIVVTDKKDLKPTEALGYCDTDFELAEDGNAVQFESRSAGKECRVRLLSGEVSCRPIKT